MREAFIVPGMALLILAPPPPAWGQAELLAPGPATLDAAVVRLVSWLERAEALARQVAALQNGMASAARSGADPCADDRRAQIAALGVAWRDAAQAARAEADRVRRIRGSPGVAPLLGGESLATLEDRLGRVDRQSRLYAEARAWQARMAPRCRPVQDAVRQGGARNGAVLPDQAGSARRSAARTETASPARPDASSAEALSASPSGE